MIEELFITHNGKVILGDPQAYPKDPEYPTHVVANKQLTQIKVNDLEISALYSNMDVFFILDYLEKLTAEIEGEVCTLTYNKVQENYFSILGVVHRYQVVITPREKSNSFAYIQSNDIYVDVIETYNVVLNREVFPKEDVLLDDSQDIVVSNPDPKNNTILRNDVMGFCFIKPGFLDTKTVKLIINKNNLNYISKNKLTEKFNKIEVEMDVTNKSQEVLKYTTKSKSPPPVSLIKENGVYKLTTTEAIFENLEIQIPVPDQIKRLKIKNSKGLASHDENMSVVKWIFKNEKVGRCYISFELETFVDQRCSNEVNVTFTIPKSSNSHMKIDKAVCLGHPGVNVWIKYDLCSGCYKIRV
ncbi:hypothetical protein NGRA_2037 [Nosema granulosis]|uniref:MHD domain-containing protein n=1 Tax=Nosema granulosis TaxID=83296 RepID=A0A9P6KY29_9MICR|nr:hypothetical protein NGRA_2037 [Nosema granulosis]